MFFSGYDAEITLELVREAGFDLEYSEVQTQFEGDHDVDYLWVLGRCVRP